MSKIKEYIDETVVEMTQNVTWPTWKELQSNTIIVVVASVLIALAIFVMDFVFGISESGFWKGILGFIYDLFQ